MKQLFMRLFFGKGTEGNSYGGYVKERVKRNKKINKSFEDGELSDDDLIDIVYKNKETLDKSVWEKLYNSTRNICGPSIGPLIFWYTFFLETEVKIELLNRGMKVYNVYDGFYFNKDITDDIKIILEQKAKFIYDNYMIPIQK